MELTINIFCQTSWQSWNTLKPSLQFTYFIKHPDNLETLWNQASGWAAEIVWRAWCRQALTVTSSGQAAEAKWSWNIESLNQFTCYGFNHVQKILSFLCYGKTAPAMSRKYWVSARANMHQQHNFWNVKLLEKEDISVKHREFKYASSPLFSSCGQSNLDFLPILPFPSSTSL